MLALLVFIGVSTACFGSQSQTQVQTSTLPQPQSTPRGDLKQSDLDRLKWIVGDWRGLDGDKPFYERYRMEEGALVVESYEDDMFSKLSDTTRYALTNGQITNGSYAVREITDDSISFVPVGKAANTFTLKQTGDATWTATLDWPATSDKPARQKVYKMERVEQHTK
jgi:hypothetical protein